MTEWMKWKYDLCENEIQCDGKTIAYSDNSIFDLPREEFDVALRSLGMRLGWLVERANMAPELLEFVESVVAAKNYIPADLIEVAVDLIAKAEGRDK